MPASAVWPYLPVTSQYSVQMAERIDVAFGTETSFDLFYTPFT